MGQQLQPLEQLGAPYRAVKAFRSLLFTAAADISSNPLLAELQHAITLQHLFSRCVRVSTCSSVLGRCLRYGNTECGTAGRLTKEWKADQLLLQSMARTKVSTLHNDGHHPSKPVV